MAEASRSCRRLALWASVLVVGRCSGILLGIDHARMLEGMANLLPGVSPAAQTMVLSNMPRGDVNAALSHFNISQHAPHDGDRVSAANGVVLYASNPPGGFATAPPPGAERTQQAANPPRAHGQLGEPDSTRDGPRPERQRRSAPLRSRRPRSPGRLPCVLWLLARPAGWCLQS